MAPELLASDLPTANHLSDVLSLGVTLHQLLTGELPLRESLGLARELAARDPDDAERQFDLGQCEFWMGALVWEAGDLGTTRGHLESAHEVLEELTARDPENADGRYRLAWSHLQLGRLEHAEGHRSSVHLKNG